MDTKKFFMLFMIMFMLFTVSGCGGSGGNTQNLSNDPISPDKPAPAPETKSDDIPLIPAPAPQSQDKPISTEPIPTPTNPIISPDPIPVRYTVSFNSNGGSTVSSITVLSGHTINKPSNPKKYGSTFKGWYKDSALTQIFTFGAGGDKVTANITLYAKWIEDSVLAEVAVEKVSIGYQDGDSANHVTKNITLPRNIDVSGDVANIIWSSNNEKVIYTNGTVTRQSTDVTVILTALSSIGTADKSRVFTLKVIHAETPAPLSYKVSFNSNGGSTVSSITVPSGNTVTKPKDPSKEGYTFGGWYKDSALTKAFKFGSNGDKVTSNITLYAKWNISDSSRADAAVKKISIGYQDGDNSSHVTGNLNLPSQVNVSGDLVSITWSSNKPDVISSKGTVTRGTSDITVRMTATATAGTVKRSKTFDVKVIHAETPAPKPTGYIVTFNTNEGSSIPSVNVSSGATLEAPANPTREGYVFVGWFKDSAFTQSFTFGADGDKITQNTTLYAQWLKVDALKADHAISEIVIDYADGDNPKYVTKNIMLPSKVGDANITWSSNSAVISSAGKVTRPLGGDADVTLTATAKVGTVSSTRYFKLKVIRKHTRVSKDVEVLPLQDAGSGDLEISYKASGDQIIDIEGNYSKIKIHNADDALDAIQAIHEALGISNPYNELQTFLATSDSYGSEYSFQQMYKGVKVYGRSVMASTNSEGEGNFLHSSFLASDVLDSANMKVNLTTSQAEAKAKANYSGNVSADTAQTERVVYSLGNYEDKPMYAYVVRVYGTSGGAYVDVNVFVNADTGEVIRSVTNICNATSYAFTVWISGDNELWTSGDNEIGRSVVFPVTMGKEVPVPQGGKMPYYQMQDTTKVPNIKIFVGSLNTPVQNIPIWTWDAHEVSAYTNMREIMQLWKESFDRNSLNNRGMVVNVITHERVANMRDNAYWHEDHESVFVCDMGDTSLYKYSPAVGIDTLTHETVHGIIYYDVPGGLPYENATGAINEGYADIFGCIKDKNWQLDERLYQAKSSIKYLRNIKIPGDVQANEKGPSKIGGQYYIDYNTNSEDHGGVHTNSFIVSHAAYLMHQDNNRANGLTWDELAKVWYKSIYMGLNSTSDFQDVRRCVIWAAKELKLNDNKLDAIRAAFDSVGITETKGTLKGAVSDYDTGAFLSGVDVTLSGTTVSNGSAIPYVIGKRVTPASGRYSFQLEAGKYTVFVAKQGYVTLSAFPSIEKMTTSDEVRMDVKLVKPGNGSLSGTIRSQSGNSPLQGVTVNLRSGWFTQTASVVQTATTNAEGHYSFDSLNNGYYTVELVKNGYETATFNVTVSGNISGKDGYLVGGGEPDEPIETEDIPIDEAHFPDEEFRAYVKSHFDINSNDVLSPIEISQVTSIDIEYHHFDSLKGIKHFTNLQYLNCNDCDLASLDLSGCTSLQYLNCSHNWYRMTSLNLRGCINLKTLNCNDCDLASLDLSGLTSLQNLDCFYNDQLKSLDVSGCLNLQTLNCYNNDLTSLNVNGCTSLQRLHCHSNQLTTLDVSSNIALNDLTCYSNRLTVLDLSNCPKLHNHSEFYGSNVECDYGVNITWPSSNTPSTFTVSLNFRSKSHTSSATEVLAVLQVFTPTQSGTYSFTVSLDRTPPEGTYLVLLADSEDIHGSFTLTELPDTVIVSADFTAGRTYAPVIVAMFEGENQSGGCNAGTVGIILLAGIMVVLAKKP